MKILMGTKNPGKIEGAKQAFEKYFDNVERIESMVMLHNIQIEFFLKQIH